MATVSSKTLEIVAGPNGSGKTSFANSYFKANRFKTSFINADIVASGLASGREELAAFRAGRIVLSAVKEKLKNFESVAFESTLSGKTWLPLVRRAKEQGYCVTVYFLFLKDVRLNIRRIEKRVRLGGHSVPTTAVKRRYPRSFQNFWHLFRPLCDHWYVFDNSSQKPKRLMRKGQWENLPEEAHNAFEVSFLEKSKLKNGKKKTG